MKTKLFLLSLVAVVAISFCACSDDDDSSSSIIGKMTLKADGTNVTLVAACVNAGTMYTIVGVNKTDTFTINFTGVEPVIGTYDVKTDTKTMVGIASSFQYGSKYYLNTGVTIPTEPTLTGTITVSKYVKSKSVEGTFTIDLLYNEDDSTVLKVTEGTFVAPFASAK
jgi:hypothetical protein